MICFLLSPLQSLPLASRGAATLTAPETLPSALQQVNGKAAAAWLLLRGLSPGSCLCINPWQVERGDRTARDPGSLAHQMCGAECRREVQGRDRCGRPAPQEIAGPSWRWSPGGQKGLQLGAEQSGAYGQGGLGPPGDELFKRLPLTVLQDSNPALPPPSHMSPRDLVPLAAWKEARGETCPCGSASGPWVRWEKTESQQPRVTESGLPPAPDAG